MRSKAPLLLMEQMVMLLVFALAAALCVQAFVKSDAISARGEARDQAVVLVQTAAETIRAAGGSAAQALATAAQQLPEAEYTDDTLRIIYDEDWQALPTDWPERNFPGWIAEAYFLEAQAMPEEAGLSHAKVSIRDDSEELFSVEVAWQMPLAED